MSQARFDTKNRFMFDDECYDDDEDEFEFDFGDRKEYLKESNLNSQKSTLPSEISQENVSSSNFAIDLRKTTSNKEANSSESKSVRQSDIVYQLNQTYYYDELDFIVEDLKNALLNKNLVLIQGLFDKHNINVNSKLKTNWTPLMYAVCCGSYEITKFLIEKGADVRFDDGKPKTDL